MNAIDAEKREESKNNIKNNKKYKQAPTKTQKIVRAESDVSTEPDTSDFERDFEGKQY